MPLSVIIPSKTVSKVAECITAVREAGHAGRILVMDDFDPTTNWEDMLQQMSKADHVVGRPDHLAHFYRCKRPFVFARNVNLGIHRAGEDDVFLLNDDAIVQNRGAFEALAKAIEQPSQIGAFSALVQGMAAAPEQQWNPELAETLYKEPWFPVKHHMIAFLAVLIPRAVIKQIGLLDERFVDYGFEDDDYCHRLKLAGLGMAIVPGCLVEHGRIPSTYRDEGKAANPDMLAPNRAVFNAKWAPEAAPAK